jgi:hypothetical protein
VKSYNGFSPEQRNRAQAWLNSQWRSGELIRPNTCCACGQDKGIIDAHAEDYSEPFAAGKTDEFHLCYRCHMMVHCRHRNREHWQKYVDAVQAGAMFAPYSARAFNIFCAELLDAWRPAIRGYREPPSANVLWDIDVYAKMRLGR